jgi:small subunit ribosomal protein S2
MAWANSDPDGVDFVIPGNDDAIKGLSLILDYVAQAVEEGKKVSSKKED